MKRGGARPGSGRPAGSGKYGEKTRTVRVPESLIKEVISFVEAKGYRLPLYDNHISAGTLTPTEGTVTETINLAEHLIKNPFDTFCVKVQGESMLGAGIAPDDILVVDRKIEPKSGDVVIANVDSESTVKRLLVKKDGVILQPENKAFAPIHVSSLSDLRIQGTVIQIIKTPHKTGI